MLLKLCSLLYFNLSLTEYDRKSCILFNYVLCLVKGHGSSLRISTQFWISRKVSLVLYILLTFTQIKNKASMV